MPKSNNKRKDGTTPKKVAGNSKQAFEARTGAHKSMREREANQTEQNTQDIRKLAENYNAFLTNLEKDLRAFQDRYNRLSATFTESFKILLEVTGKVDDYNAAAEKLNRQKLEAEVEASKKALATLIEAGVYVAEGSALNDEAVFVGHDVDLAGATIHPGYVQFQLKGVEAQQAEKLKGAVVGDMFELVPGRTLVIDGVYNFYPEKLQKKNEPVAIEPAPAATG